MTTFGPVFVARFPIASKLEFFNADGECGLSMNGSIQHRPPLVNPFPSLSDYFKPFTTHEELTWPLKKKLTVTFVINDAETDELLLAAEMFLRRCLHLYLGKG